MILYDFWGYGPSFIRTFYGFPIAMFDHGRVSSSLQGTSRGCFGSLLRGVAVCPEKGACPPTWCYVVRCVAGWCRLLDMMKSFMFRYNAGDMECLGKARQELRRNKASPRNSFQCDEDDNTLQKNSMKHKNNSPAARGSLFFQVTNFQRRFKNTANTTQCRQSLEKKMRFLRGRNWRRSLVMPCPSLLFGTLIPLPHGLFSFFSIHFFGWLNHPPRPGAKQDPSLCGIFGIPPAPAWMFSWIRMIRGWATTCVRHQEL